MKPLRILLVSSRPTALRALLEQAGREIVCASTADEALARLEAGADALVLIEEDAGALDGPAVLRQLREQVQAADTMYVPLAASADPEHLLEAWGGGADDCLAPPFDPRLLAIRIDRLGEALLHRLRLRERSAELETALRNSELLAAVLGHDLRNPLAAIATGAELLRRSQDPAIVERTAQRMHASAQRMAAMVERLLDVTRQRAGPAFARIDLGVLARRIADEFVRPEHAGRVRVQLAGALDMEADASALGQVLSNLVGNALKHGDAGTAVTLTVDGGDADRLRITVHNEGSVEVALAERLTEPFVRRAGSKGVGLGLYIVNQMVALHGGQLTLESSAAEGTTATVVLPRRREVAVSESSDSGFGRG